MTDQVQNDPPMAGSEEEIFGYYYGEEDKQLLDPAWERQQKKVYNTLFIFIIV